MQNALASQPLSPLRRITHHRSTSIVAVALAAVLLVSMGGAIIAAPLTLPILYLIARTHGTALRICAAVVAALTVGEAAWAVTYMVFGESQSAIWALPVAATLATGAFMAPGARSMSPTPST